MNIKETTISVVAGAILGAGGSHLAYPDKIDLKAMGNDLVWEQTYNGTDGLDKTKIWLMAKRVSHDGTVQIFILPKDMVKQ